MKTILFFGMNLDSIKVNTDISEGLELCSLLFNGWGMILKKRRLYMYKGPKIEIDKIFTSYY
ncbi:MAG TPA: hypothetical protein VFG45_08150 [Candidatus Nitrosocosmicus sp.]|jgi:adenylate cyclase class IV|uniref:hypothetical protein n=1 Tax=Candidatus Nitrosocosmicus agrestis TaxID=2563600 RepID=UPI00122DE23D|nr:hypothetical protein [Candidatus Nitrosocosmicus sp. SS]KAF0869399.1 hypothetical protein E5N71_04975 [Candidatus Nitrosocosmicus sp. SS]HET6590118.1 hypothetical protein [Candidatus Nitrosocosmicus sp.]